MKRLIAAWKDHGKVTAFGRAMLANSMIFSRFRYYAQSMRISDPLMEAIEEDAQALKNHLKSIDFAKKKATVTKTEEAAKGGKK